MTEVLERFDQVVRERAEAIAIDAHDAVWSFGDLDEVSRGLAERLRAVGVRAGDVIALRTGRSAWHVAGMLAAWRLGAAFMPVDPDGPADREQVMLAESRAHAVVRAGGGVVEVGQPLRGSVDDVAYVVYTSGSTGRPKGVRVGHSGLVPMLAEQIAMFGLGPGMRALLTLSTVFDASISDIGTALLSGATLVIPQRQATPETLVELLRTLAITHADLPPSMLPFVDPEILPSTLRTVVIGGEVCPPATVRSWAARVRLVNVYGPTEATVCTSMGVCDPETWGRPLIGTPLPHVDYELVDGELLIAGAAVALGYVDQPGLEAERFVVRHGRRWYRTGDLVRRRGDGAWEFLGRIDRQVKIRGRLVCPEEIEARLREIEGVAEVAVVPEERDAQVVLTAYARLGSGVELSVAEIRGLLGRVLPEWMVPRVALVDSLVRNGTGKVDHRALAGASAAPIAQHRTQVIAEAFAAALGVAGVGGDDDFLQLGGDSLAALEVAARARLDGVSIESTTVMAARTPNAIARAPRTPDRTIADLDGMAAEIAAEIGSTALGRGGGSDWLVTGATGFLGERLVRELLARTDARVHCVVRAVDDAEAVARIGRHPRLRAYAGDVSAPRLGLSRERWEQLAEEVGFVLHGAASLSLSLPYGELAAVNVRGTAEVARFVRASGARMHYVSSLAVLAATDLDDGVLDERTVLGPGTRIFGGYPQTKWVAEELLRRSVPELRVIRPGLLTGDSVTGVGAASCPLAAFLRAVAVLRCLPDVDQDILKVNVTPVDHCANAIAKVVVGGARAPVVHVATEHGTSLRDLSEAMGGFVGVARVSTAEFMVRVREQLSRSNALAMVTSAYRLVGADEHRDADLFLQTGRRFPGLGLPAVDGRLLARYAELAVRDVGEGRGST